MTHADHDVRIARPVAEVFQFFADGDNNPRWQHLVVSTDVPDGPVGVGSIFRQRARHPLGFTVAADYRVTEFVIPTRLALRIISGGPLRPTMTFDLIPESDVTTAVRCAVDLQPTGLARLANPALGLLHPLFARQAASVARARPLLETGTQPAA
jgi:uncharacterized protein YndB with AHSA1/START domain